MRSLKWSFFAGCSVVFGIGMATACLICIRGVPERAWTIDEPEQVVLYPGDGQTAEATFCIRNTSRTALRILGTNAC
jgi:hypothetical protein